MTAYTQRVEVGAYYTDGHYLAEVTEVNPLGYIHMTDVRTNDALGAGIDAFRRRWWLVREAQAAGRGPTPST